MDEGEDQFPMTYAKTGAAIGQQPNGIAFQIFDQKTLEYLEPRYAHGTPIKDDTIEGLARKLGIDPTALSKTVSEFNASTPSGTFDPWHKDGLATASTLQPPKTNWALPIDQAPFVAYSVAPGLTFTYGGLKIDTEARVLNNEDKVMPAGPDSMPLAKSRRSSTMITLEEPV